MPEHRTVSLLRRAKPGDSLVLGGRNVEVVEPTGTERRILTESVREQRELGAIEVEGGKERMILFGRPSSVPVILYKMGIRNLQPLPGARVIVSHSHWEVAEDVRPSDDDLLYAQQLQEGHPNFSLRCRVVCGRPDKPLAFQYFPLR